MTRTKTLRSPEQSESGVALLMVLLLVAVIGIITPALVAGGGTTFRQTSLIRNVDLRETGTNGGVEWAVQTIKSGSSAYCQSSGLWTKDLTIGDRIVRVFCKMAAGSTPSGPGGLALYGTGGVIDIGGPLGATVNGPVYNAGTYALGTLTVNGQVSAPGGCTTTTNGPAGLTSYFMNGAFSVISQCTIPLSDMSSPLGDATEPGAPAGLPVNSTDTNGQPCRVFKPGKYSAPPVLLANNFFEPGVYYFEWPSGTGTWNISSALRAGNPAPATTTSSGDGVLSTIYPCVTAAAATQNGAQFIFGNGAKFAVRNQGRLEIFSYQTAGGVLPGVRAIVRGAQATTLGIPADPWGKSSIVASPTPLFSVGNGAKAELAIHGGVYAPASFVKMRGTNTSVAKITGTTVVNSLDTFAPVSFTDNAFVDVFAGVGSRQFLLMARSESVGAEPPLCSSASITVYNNGSVSPPTERSYNLSAWRVDRQPGTGSPESVGPDGASCVLP